MTVFEPYDDKKMRKSTKIVGIIVGIALIVLAVYISSIYTGLVGGIILLAIGFSKNTVVNDDGLLVSYGAFFFKYKELWPFDEITDIHKEIVADPKYKVLHFGKDVMVRRLVFTSDRVDEVIDFALSKNEKIHVDEVDNSKK